MATNTKTGSIHWNLSFLFADFVGNPAKSHFASSGGFTTASHEQCLVALEIDNQDGGILAERSPCEQVL
jgi:hypothetical protein